MVTKDEMRVAEARSSLDRIAAEAGAFDSAMPSAGPKTAQAPERPAPPADGIERWGRIIGRTLGWVAALFLAWQFFRSFGV